MSNVSFHSWVPFFPYLLRLCSLCVVFFAVVCFASLVVSMCTKFNARCFVVHFMLCACNHVHVNKCFTFRLFPTFWTTQTMGSPMAHLCNFTTVYQRNLFVQFISILFAFSFLNLPRAENNAHWNEQQREKERESRAEKWEKERERKKQIKQFSSSVFFFEIKNVGNFFFQVNVCILWELISFCSTQI